jgi:hypothetical protein
MDASGSIRRMLLTMIICMRKPNFAGLGTKVADTVAVLLVYVATIGVRDTVL